jgi:hypothetical protein
MSSQSGKALAGWLHWWHIDNNEVNKKSVGVSVPEFTTAW